MNKSSILRLDNFLAENYELTRSQANKLIKNSQILVNKKIITKSSYHVLPHDEIKVLNLKLQDDFEVKTDFDIEILYEDEDILVINKPANLVVHKAPSVKEATLVDWLLSKNYPLSTLNDDENRLGIVHRIDKETSGALIVAKTNKAHEELKKDFQEGRISKFYLMLTDLPLKENLLIQRKIGRNPKNRLKKAIVPDGRKAKTSFVNLLSENSKNLIAAKLYTGRTHQIRVHLASLNRHILYDDLYGFKSKSDKMRRFMLHSYILAFNHPLTKQPLEFKAKLSEDFLEEIKNIDKGKIDEKLSCLTSLFDDDASWLQLN